MTKVRCVIYVRQSQDRTGEELAVTRQLRDARALAAARGWTVVAVHEENDTSAAGKVRRPKFDAVLAALDSGQASAVIAWDMTRLTRNRRDTLRLLEVEGPDGKPTHRQCVLAFVRGSDLDLTTPAGRLTADILAGVARHEIDQKADRQKAAIAQAVAAGRRLGGRRPFGYEADGIAIRPAEAKAMAEVYAGVLAGRSLAGLARDLNAAGHTTAQGNPWTGQSLSTALRNPRYAGLRGSTDRTGPGRPKWTVHGPAVWKGIVTEDVWRAVDDIVRDPARLNAPTIEGSALLTGIATCGVCGSPVHGGGHGAGRPTYRCRASTGHVVRARGPIDDLVAGVVVERLSRADLADVLPADDAPRMAELRTQATALRGRRAGLARLFADGVLTESQTRIEAQRLDADLAATEREMADRHQARVLVGYVGERNARRFLDADLDIRRSIIELLVRVVIHPAGQGRRTFDPETVEITWQS